jgi:hypothetical protein
MKKNRLVKAGIDQAHNVHHNIQIDIIVKIHLLFAFNNQLDLVTDRVDLNKLKRSGNLTFLILSHPPKSSNSFNLASTCSSNSLSANEIAFP